MRKLFFILIISVFSFQLIAQEETYEQNFKVLGEPKYFQDFITYYSVKDQLPRVDIYIQVPYKNIQFVKSGQGFTARYSVTASVFDEDKERLIVEKTWNQTVNQIDFQQTIVKENYSLSMRSFDLEPGTYNIRTAVTDRDSRQEYNSENLYTVPEFDEKYETSGLLLISGVTVAESDSQIIPNISRNVKTSEDGLSLYYEIYSKADSSKDLVLQYSISNKDNEVIHKELLNKKITPGTNQLFHKLDDLDLELGTFVVAAAVLDDDHDEISSSKKSFFSRWIGLPTSIKDLERAIAQLVYIASPEELSYIEDAKDRKEQTDRFLAFWKAKDPSPNDEANAVFDEYYRRIAFANENFSHYMEGWRSDRGMVFVILGPPNNVDRHPFEYDSKPYEIWEYYDLNKSFIFVDETGFGDYRLVTPLYGDLFRYRP